MKLPLVNASTNSKEDQKRFKGYLKPYPIDPRKMAELDCLEVYYPEGIAGFLNESLAKYLSGYDPDNESGIWEKRVFKYLMCLFKMQKR